MAKPKKFKYPKTLLVLKTNADTNDEYLQAETNLNDFTLEPGKTVPIGMYELKSTIKATNKTSIV